MADRRGTPADAVDVVTVDEHGRRLDRAGKLDAHAPPGIPHLGFSVQLVGQDGALLLQQRSQRKYHFAGLWSNSCCGHPRPGEDLIAAATRRVHEELRLRVLDLKVMRAFWYRAKDPASGLVEVEYDVVLHGRCSDDPTPDPAEVDAVAWYDPDDAKALCRRSPAAMTPWFGRVLSMATA